MIRRHILITEPVFIEQRGLETLNLRKIEKIKLTDLNSIMDQDNQDVSTGIFNITKMRLGELSFLKMSNILPILKAHNIHPAAVILECILETQKQLNYRYNIQPYWCINEEAFASELMENILKDYFLPASKDIGRVVDTYDIFEAFSVTADISFLSSTEGLDAVLKRIEVAMKSDEYTVILKMICSRLGINFTPKSLAECVPFIMMVLDFSLDVQTLPHSSILSDLPSWHDIYPPAKLSAILEYCELLPLDIQEISLDELILLRGYLKSQFKQPTSESNIQQQPSFFNFLRKLEEGSNEFKELLSKQNKSYDVMDYYTELFFSFKKHEFETKVEGISNQFHTGQLNNFAYRKPPMIFVSGEMHINPDMLGNKFLENNYLMFSNIMAMDDYLFNPDHVSIFPINKKLYQQGLWYETQLSSFLSNLERMKQDHKISP